MSAQLNITSSRTSGNWADYYVNNVLLGAGVTAFNITFDGCDTSVNGIGLDSTQIGEFTANTPTIDIPFGLMLSSGGVEVANANATNPAAGPGVSDNATDSDLELLIPGFDLHNKAVLEFDFVPQGDSVKFKYVFGSEEYPNYVCSSFNDVFGFFLSGPGINGTYSNNAVNLAVIPGTNTEVAINTVNDVAGGGQCSSPCPCNSQYFVNNYTAPVDSNNSINGLTVTLQAEYEVNCGDTYHIKMAIADAGDGILDSYVFLEGGSFTSNIVEVGITTVNGDSTINEGCGTAEIQFFRSDTTDTSITPLFFSGTATNGVDFTFIPDSILLLPGQSDTTIVIDPFNDGLNEGMEFITIEAWTINPCGDTFISSGNLYFFDVPNLNIELSDTILKCPADSLPLSALVLSGGPPPYTYDWSTGQSGPEITVPAIQSNGFDTIIVEVEDSCALYTLYDTLIYERNVSKYPRVNILIDTLVDCPDDTATLTYSSLFGSGQSTFEWESGNDSTLNENVIVNGTMTYLITMTDSCGRSDVDTANLGVVERDEMDIGLDDTTVNCPADTFTLMPQVSGGFAPYDYAWALQDPQFTDSLNRFVELDTDSLIVFWLRDKCGRTTNDTIRAKIKDIEELDFVIPDQEVACDGVEVTLVGQSFGGIRPYSYRWSTSPSDTDSVLTLTVNLDQEILVTITDLCGRTDTTSANIDTPEFPNLDLWLSESNVLCLGDEYEIEAIGIGGAGGYSYSWSYLNAIEDGEVYEKLDSNLFRVVPFRTNTHLIEVRDFCNNVYVDSLQIVVDPCIFIPNVITPNGDGQNDVFMIKNANNVPDARLTVYNRWGTKVYESSNYLNDWTPVDQNSGVYFYILESDYFDPLRGDVTIIND